MPPFAKREIKNSFIKLLTERPISQITVKDIVEDCGVNRNSFYYHFQDIPSLLEEIIVDKNVTPVYIYIVCDIVPKIEEFADLSGLSISPDKQGYFGYNPKYNAYIEIKSFKKVIDDAKMRNQIFFKKLGLC